MRHLIAATLATLTLTPLIAHAQSDAMPAQPSDNQPQAVNPAPTSPGPTTVVDPYGNLKIIQKSDPNVGLPSASDSSNSSGAVNQVPQTTPGMQQSSPTVTPQMPGAVTVPTQPMTPAQPGMQTQPAPSMPAQPTVPAQPPATGTLPAAPSDQSVNPPAANTMAPANTANITESGSANTN